MPRAACPVKLGRSGDALLDWRPGKEHKHPGFLLCPGCPQYSISQILQGFAKRCTSTGASPLWRYETLVAIRQPADYASSRLRLSRFSAVTPWRALRGPPNRPRRPGFQKP